jgi:integrase
MARDGLQQRHRKGCRGGKCDCPWRANAWDNHRGKRIVKTFKTRTEAKLWRRDAQHALTHGQLNAPSAITVEQALRDLIDGMGSGRVLDRSGKLYKPASIRSYEAAARLDAIPALGGRKLSDVRRRDVQAYVDRLRARGLSPSTVLNRLDVLRVLYRRAVRDELIAVDPCADLDLPAVRPERRVVAGLDRARALLAALPAPERALWATMFYAGLRRGEARALRWRDVDFDGGVVRVERGWDDVEGEQDPKSCAGRRVVPLAGRLRAELAAHKLATGRGADDLAFGRTPSDPFIPATVRMRARKAWGWRQERNPDSAGPRRRWVKAHEDALKPLTPHEARHTCASYLIAAGLNPKQVQTYIGHSDVRTTFNVYGHLLPGDETTAAAQLDALLGEAPVVPPVVPEDPENAKSPAVAGLS